MATNMDKALYQAPLGMAEDDEGEMPIEIEIEDPEAVHIGIGDLEIDIESGVDEDEFNKNLVRIAQFENV